MLAIFVDQTNRQQAVKRYTANVEKNKKDLIKVFDTANSNKFQVIGEKDSSGKIIGPALATNTDSNYDKIVDDIENKDRMENYQGGIKVVDFDDPFGDPEKMNDFIESIKTQYYAISITSFRI